MRWREWVICLMPVVTCLVLPQAAGAEPVQIRAAANSQGSRIALVWQAPVAYQAGLSGRELTLSFNRPIDADLSILTGDIPAFVVATNRSADGLQLALSLTGEFDLVHYPTGSTIVIDLIGSPGGVVADSAPTGPAEEAGTEPSSETQADEAIDTSALPQVEIRTGRHADKLRLVFDWDRVVPYAVSRDGGVATITFNSPAAMDVSRLSGILPNILGDARYRATQQTSIVELSIADGADMRDFYADTKIVLDIVFPADGSTAGTLPDAGPSTIVSSSGPVPDAGADENAGEQVTGHSTAELAEAEPPANETAVESLAGTESPGSPTDLTATDVTPVAGASSNAPQGIIESSAEANAEGFSLRFDWDEPVAASVFRRGSAVWVVFDKPAAVDVASMRTVAGDQLLDLVQIPHPAATVLRAVTAQGVNPLPKREGLAWVFEFARQSLSTLSPVEAVAQPESPVGARVFLPVPEPGKAVALVDPEMGGHFVTVPLIPLGYGVTHFYEYPQFRIRPSSQGLVIEPRIDTLRIRPGRQGVAITSTRALHISPVSNLDLARARAGSDRPLSRIANFELLQNVSVELFNDQRQELEHAIARSPDHSEKTEGRFELVQFFLAHGYAAEALGVLRVLADEAPDAKKRVDYRLYRGMANYLMGRLKEAREDLKDSQLDKYDEGIFWRSLVEFVDGNEEADSLRGLRSTGRIPEPYPPALRVPLIMRVIEASIKVGDSDRAQELVELLGAEGLGPKELGEWYYLSGVYNEFAGDFDAAIANFEEAIQSEHRPSRVFATYARAELERDLDRISTIDTIDELETLRFAWRGGDFELQLLRRLGDLYLSQGGYRQGLTALRQAATHFREKEGTEQITQRMSDTFAYLFLKDGADRLPPVTAIALYEEFKELTPAGELGDQMIRRLADRLVRVDLLEEASDLLDGQVKFRLQGVEKARVGAQLAVVRLLARDYDGALEALDVSDEADLPDELVLQRTHLQSRALSGTGDVVGALDLLDDDETQGAEQLRAEQYWALKDWPRAAQALRRLLVMDDIAENVPLAPEQALRILNYCIALTLSGNDRGLDSIRRKYGAAMVETDLKDAFLLIAAPEQFELITAEAIPSNIQVAENFQTFLTAYKQRLEDQSLSEIN